jgi:Ig-like domain CHU_C associated/Secretion system C-terminal sorting domain
LVAAQGSISIPICRSTSPGVKLNGQSPSVAAVSAGRNKNNVCPGIAVKVYRTGGSLGVGATWKWYTGSPGGTLVGTGDTLSFLAPTVTTTYYIRAEGTCNTTAAQSVTITINCDVDKDDDGVPDFVESNMAAAFLDVPANGIINAYDPLTAGFVDYNNDFVNDNYQADGDSDNDGIKNYLDTDFPGRIDLSGPLGVPDGIDDRFDTDLDGKINMLDLDSDNDGIPDVVEAYGVDTNGDGKIDNYTDTDGDGLSDNVDSRIIAADGAYNTGTGLGLPNLDGDVAPNFLDLDSDNDGIPDIVEVGAPDTNNNGKVDGFTDANGDGLHDSYINAGALLITGTDTDADGRANSYPNKNLDRDFRPNAYDMDSDGDGIVDVIEAGLPDADLNGIVDGTIAANGWSTSVSGLGSLGLRNTDADGKPDYLDIDSDDDGIPDNIEGQSTASYKFPTLTDADGDGLMLPYDNQPAAFGGTGITPYNHDGDALPDYRDLDSDGDGLIDRVEGNDFNLNGAADDNVTLTGLDTDGDGLDDRFDSLNSVTIVKGTSYRMGTSGSFAGDATPGSRTTVQRTIATQPDRDWRYAGYVLPVRFLNLTGVLQTGKVLLNWAVIADKAIDHFEVERSIDNSVYTKTGIVSQPVTLNVQQNFTFTDDITGVTKEIIYYRIKVVGKGGEIQYSNILVVRRQQNKTPLSIVPNPAKDNVSVTFFANTESVVTIRMIDDNGKLVLLQNQKVAKGNNTIQLNGLDKYSNGVYILQVYVNDEVVSQKLVLIK